MRIAAPLLVLVLAMCASAQEKPPAKENGGLPLLFHEDFAKPDQAMKRFTVGDKSAWRIIEDDVDGAKRNVLSLFKQSDVKNAVRSPFNQAWINNLKVTHFVMEVRCKITAEPVPHRDLCFFFGGVDATHFLYAHVAQKEDKIHNQIHIVDGKDREPVTTRRSDGTPWDDKYHTVKIVRNESGASVYFDGKPTLGTDRKEMPAGKLGIGSFDDIGNFASVTVWGKRVE